MNLTTNIPFSKANFPMDYSSEIVLLGSCFVENIGNKLAYFKFKNLLNPFGILFHPKAIEVLIANAVNNKGYTEEDVFFKNEQWHCFDAHSKVSHPLKNELVDKLNNRIHVTKQQLNNSTHIIITLGTAWVYRFTKTNRIVSNCHKVPQKEFQKELLAVDDIVKSLETMTDLIKSVNPSTVIIFTVSPVRHIKDGFVENTQSKSHLIAAIHQFLKEKPSISNGNSFYFPSYEIMMDELRDYRFYDEDMVHPNKIAINYIWEKFMLVWISKETFKTMDDVDAVQKGLLHKPFNPNSEAYQKFIQQLDAKKALLQAKYSHITF